MSGGAYALHSAMLDVVLDGGSAGVDVLHPAAATTVVALALDGPSPSVAAGLVEDLSTAPASPRWRSTRAVVGVLDRAV